MVQEEIVRKRQVAKAHYDKTAGVELSMAKEGDYVYVKPRSKGKPWHYGVVVKNPTSRSYVVRSGLGEIRRNRAQVRLAAPPPPAPVDRTMIPVPQGGTNTLRLNASLAQRFSARPTGPQVTEPLVSNEVGEKSHCEDKPEHDTAVETRVGPSAPMSTYTTRSGRIVKPKVVFDPSQ